MNNSTRGCGRRQKFHVTKFSLYSLLGPKPLSRHRGGSSRLLVMVDLSWFRRRQQAGLRPYDKPARERHIVSVVCSCLCVLLLILSLSLQEWGKAETSNCKFTFKLTQVVIEDKVFNHDYSFSSKSMKYASKQATLPLPAVTEYYSNSQQILISCVISVSALAIISSLISATISAGYPRERLEFLRHYSVFNIISCTSSFASKSPLHYYLSLSSFVVPYIVLCIVLVAGLWLGVAQFLPTDKQIMTCGVPKTGIESQFSYAYYLFLVGGLFSLGAAAFNLLFARTAAERRRSVRSRFRR